MHSKFTLIRAISGEFLKRKLASVLLRTGIVLAVLLIISVWLITKSAWWWLFAMLVLFVVALWAGVAIVGNIAIKLLRPVLTPAQASNVAAFVDKLERVTEHVGTPMFLIVFKVMRDLLWPREESFIKSVASDSTTLHKDFAQLEKDFRKSE